MRSVFFKHFSIDVNHLFCTLAKCLLAIHDNLRFLTSAVRQTGRLRVCDENNLGSDLAIIVVVHLFLNLNFKALLLEIIGGTCDT